MLWGGIYAEENLNTRWPESEPAVVQSRARRSHWHGVSAAAAL